MAMKILSLSLLFLLLFGCGTVIDSNLVSESDKKSLQESLFRFQLENVDSFTGEDFEGYCLSSRISNITSDLMDSLSGNGPELHMSQDCPKKIRTLLISVSRVEFFSTRKAVVYGGYTSGNVSGIEYKYSVSRSKNGKWRVKKYKVRYVS